MNNIESVRLRKQQTCCFERVFKGMLQLALNACNQDTEDADGDGDSDEHEDNGNTRCNANCLWTKLTAKFLKDGTGSCNYLHAIKLLASGYSDNTTRKGREYLNDICVPYCISKGFVINRIREEFECQCWSQDATSPPSPDGSRLSSRSTIESSIPKANGHEPINRQNESIDEEENFREWSNTSSIMRGSGTSSGIRREDEEYSSDINDTAIASGSRSASTARKRRQFENNEDSVESTQVNRPQEAPETYPNKHHKSTTTAPLAKDSDEQMTTAEHDENMNRRAATPNNIITPRVVLEGVQRETKEKGKEKARGRSPSTRRNMTTAVVEFGTERAKQGPQKRSEGKNSLGSSNSSRTRASRAASNLALSEPTQSSQPRNHATVANRSNPVEPPEIWNKVQEILEQDRIGYQVLRASYDNVTGKQLASALNLVSSKEISAAYLRNKKYQLLKNETLRALLAQLPKSQKLLKKNSKPAQVIQKQNGQRAKRLNEKDHEKGRERDEDQAIEDLTDDEQMKKYTNQVERANIQHESITVLDDDEYQLDEHDDEV